MSSFTREVKSLRLQCKDAFEPAPDFKQGMKADVVIVGAGFAGITALYHLRKLGLSCRILERGTDIGGVWHWNCYPGARTDSDVPSYEFPMAECWEDWEWSSNYPDHTELQAYFAHCDEKLQISQHVSFGITVVGARFIESSNHWTLYCCDGQTVTCKYLVIATGCTSETAVFTQPDLHNFGGDVYYPSRWPRQGVNPRGKHVAVVGTGSTGVQIVQEWGGQAKSLTVFQRTPNLAIPMHLEKDPLGIKQRQLKVKYPEMMENRKHTPCGLADAMPISRASFEDGPNERKNLYNQLYDRGGLRFFVSSYRDTMLDHAANRQLYDFWAEKTRPRIVDPEKRNILAPLDPPHPFGTKRPSLERDYFEQFNRATVDVVNLNTNPIVSFTHDGVVTQDNRFYPADILVPAIGFKSVVEVLTSLGIEGLGGMGLADAWAEGARTYLGVVCHGFPNMFIIGGPQAPSEMGNVPTSIEVQGEWIAKVVTRMEKAQTKNIHPTAAAVDEWVCKVRSVAEDGLYITTNSRYMSQSRVGGDLQPVYYGGGIPTYVQELENALQTWGDVFESHDNTTALVAFGDRVRNTTDIKKEWKLRI